MCSDAGTRLKKDAIVIGGGITGLTAAYMAKTQGRSVCIFEPGRIGGVIKTHHTRGCTLEQGPNVLLLKPRFKTFLEELGLASQIVRPAIKNYSQLIWHDNKMVKAPRGPASALFSPLLAPRDRLLLIPRAVRPGVLKPGKEDESVAEFTGKILGTRAVESLVDGAFKGIYGGDVSRLSARSLLSSGWSGACEGRSLLSMMKNRNGPRPESVTIRGGIETLVERLQDKIDGRVELIKRAARSLTYSHKRFELTDSSGRCYEASQVYVCTSGSATAGYVSTLAPELTERLETVRYAPLVVVHCLVRGAAAIPEDSFGLLFPTSAQSPVLGVMFNSNLFPHVAPEDSHVLTVCLGGVKHRDVIDMENSEIERLVLDHVRSTLGVVAEPCGEVVRWPNAIPQLELGHFHMTSMFEQVEQRYPGVHFLGPDRGGVGVPDRVITVLSCMEERS